MRGAFERGFCECSILLELRFRGGVRWARASSFSVSSSSLAIRVSSRSVRNLPHKRDHVLVVEPRERHDLSLERFEPFFIDKTDAHLSHVHGVERSDGRVASSVFW